jgi:tagatose 1,6-diphosphate aldolase
LTLIEAGNLCDGELRLELDRYVVADPEREWLPTYHYNMRLAGSLDVIGRINLRIGNPDRIVLYRGHIGYSVNPEYRGHHYAARSLILLTPLAAAHGLDILWITCDPENMASRRTCELAGADLVEIIEVPPYEEMYQLGIRLKCRYRLVTVGKGPDGGSLA